MPRKAAVCCPISVTCFMNFIQWARVTLGHLITLVSDTIV